MTNKITVTVPATAANLGPGFDCLGLALELRNLVTFIETEGGLSISINGEGASVIPTDETNLVVRSAERLFERVGRRPAGLRIIQENRIPVSSGLGSSAATVLAGILGANALTGALLSRSDLLALAAETEGHPDNVAPAMFGGLTLVSKDGEQLLVDQLPVAAVEAVIVLPDFRLPTAEARAALPRMVPLPDAVFNASHLGLLMRALESLDYDKLIVAMQDRLHQPYRLPLIPGMNDVFAEVQAAGGAIALSGAGPAVIAFAPDRHDLIEATIVGAFEKNGLSCRSWHLPIDRQGSRVVSTL